MLMHIEIDGKQVPFKASAAIPRIYRMRFRRDIFADMNKLAKSLEANDENNSALDTISLEIFEDIAYLMAKHADPSVPDTAEEWLDQFETFSIYHIMPKIAELWKANLDTQVESKKNLDRVTAH